MKKRNEFLKDPKFSRPSSRSQEGKDESRYTSARPARDSEKGGRSEGPVFKSRKKTTEKLFNKPTLKKSDFNRLKAEDSPVRKLDRDDRLRDKRATPEGDSFRERPARDFNKPAGGYKSGSESGRSFDRNRDDRSSDRPRRDDRGSRPQDSPRRDFDRPRNKDRGRGDRDSDRPARRDFDRPREESGPRRDERGSASSSRNERAPRDFDRNRDERGARSNDFRREGTPGGSDQRRDSARPTRNFDRDRDERTSDRPRRDTRDDRSRGDGGPFRKGLEQGNRKFDRNRTEPPRSEVPRDSRRNEKQDGPSEAKNRRAGRFSRPPRYDFSDYEDRKPKVQKHTDDDVLRLNRYIANAGICSRREADELIEAGQITVNGAVVTEMGYKVKRSDVVKYGKKLLNPERMVYLLINKPKDYITTTEDPDDRRTVMDLVAGACEERIYPVGRLDRNTTGLLLLTNDGELAKKLTHPSSNVKKIYQAELDKPITTEDFEAMQAGFELEDGFVKPDDLGIVTPDAMVVGLEIHSGRNRIVRRMFEHFGYEVQKLDRTVFAGLNKKDLPRGKWRFLNEKEVIKLKFLL
ncbi:pseudouridine synthase [Salmonirosea aquatica]|uniref:Pseudouridine synthase n=1 Tax=Salmonirosea aquatica TaxID=2654236 RepID=A0A7C9BBJ7_9BACT|nr:pseudouridine synthase [Cytophagaceae bacterium SJW1-29]